MSDYSGEIADALASIKEAGAQFDFTLQTVTKNPTEPWRGGTTQQTPIKLWACVFPASSTPSALRTAMFGENGVIKQEYRYILAAGEGRLVHPGTGDVMHNVEGRDGSIYGCAPLTVNGQGAIIYEMVIKL